MGYVFPGNGQNMDPPANEGTQVTQSCEPANATIATQSAAPPNPGDKPPLHPQTQVNEKASGRKSSKAWDHFNKVIDEKGNIKGVCKHCGKEYLANGRVHGTSNLLSHIKIVLRILIRILERVNKPWPLNMGKTVLTLWPQTSLR